MHCALCADTLLCPPATQLSGTQGRALKGKLHVRVRFIIEKRFNQEYRPQLLPVGHKAFRLRTRWGECRRCSASCSDVSQLVQVAWVYSLTYACRLCLGVSVQHRYSTVPWLMHSITANAAASNVKQQCHRSMVGPS